MQNALYKDMPRYTLIAVNGRPTGVWRDNKDRIDFDRSKYIPGNGPDHRLGKPR